jgi:hypothetical protein
MKNKQLGNVDSKLSKMDKKLKHHEEEDEQKYVKKKKKKKNEIKEKMIYRV